MLARGSIGPFVRRALAAGRSGETDIEAAAGCVVDIADDPILAVIYYGREVLTASASRLSFCDRSAAGLSMVVS